MFLLLFLYRLMALKAVLLTSFILTIQRILKIYSILCLRRSSEIQSVLSLRRILKTAPWSAEQYGLYRFREAGSEAAVKPEVQPDREVKAVPPMQPEPAACEQLALDLGDLMPPPAVPSDAENPAEPKPEPIIKAEAAPETAPGWEQLALAVPAAGRTEARIGTVRSVSGKWGKAGKSHNPAGAGQTAATGCP